VPDPGRAEDLVLVIDDDEAARDLMRQFLAREGFDVVTARHGAEGLEVARRQRPGLITLDVLMPGLDGWDVLRQLKADPELAAIPVVMLTILDEKNKGFALGAADYMTKPFDRDRLRVVLARHRGLGAGRSVLIVEDDPDTRASLRRALTAEGWLVREAEHGRAALDQLGDGPVDLVLLDLMMPEMDGFEFLAEFRRRADGQDVPVVVVTAADLTAEDHARLDGGVLHVLQKAGSTRDQLLAELRRLVAQSVAQPAPVQGPSTGSAAAESTAAEITANG
jgi:CheY-like chemotaxis protein